MRMIHKSTSRLTS